MNKLLYKQTNNYMNKQIVKLKNKLFSCEEQILQLKKKLCNKE